MTVAKVTIKRALLFEYRYYKSKNPKKAMDIYFPDHKSSLVVLWNVHLRIAATIAGMYL